MPASRIGPLSEQWPLNRTLQAAAPIGERTNPAVRIGLGSFAALLSAQWGLSLSQVRVQPLSPLLPLCSPRAASPHSAPSPSPQAGGFIPLLLQAFGLGGEGSGPLQLALPGPQRPVVGEAAAGLYHLLMGWWAALDGHAHGFSRAEARAHARGGGGLRDPPPLPLSGAERL